MAEFKSKLHDMMNVSHGLNIDRAATQRSSIKKDLILDTLSSLNESELVSFSSFKFKKNRNRPSASSSYRNSNTHTHTLSSSNNTGNVVFDTYNSIQNNSKFQIDWNYTSDIKSNANRKFEFLQIKYSDLLKKKEDSQKRSKNNKYIKFLENSHIDNTVNSKRSDFRYTSNNSNEFKPTKTKFLKELQDFSQSLTMNYNTRRVYNIKPPVSVKASIDTKSFVAFSPTLNKNLITKTSMLRTTMNEKSISMLSNRLNDGKHTQPKNNGYILSKLIM